MGATGSNADGWKAGLARELNRDKKRTALLFVLLVVVGVLAGRLIVTHSLPEKAAAGGSRGDDDHREKLAEGSGGDGVADWLAANRRERAARREKYLANMDRNTDRDLFTPKLDCFPFISSRRNIAVRGPTETGWLGEVREQVMEKHQAQSQQAVRVAAVRAEARTLSLTSTMLGRSPAAVINGLVVRKGEYISGFRLERIGSKKCTLSKDGIHVDLTME